MDKVFPNADLKNYIFYSEKKPVILPNSICVFGGISTDYPGTTVGGGGEGAGVGGACVGTGVFVGGTCVGAGVFVGLF